MKPIHVGMSEMRVSRSGLFACIGLGSCVGIAALDPKARIGGMLHVMLPAALPGHPVDKPGKFANTGIPFFVESLEREGASRRRLKIALAGGSRMFRFQSETGSEVGMRNVAAVNEALRGMGLGAVAQDAGGMKGRTMTMDVETGEVRLRPTGEEERWLCTLAS